MSERRTAYTTISTRTLSRLLGLPEGTEIISAGSDPEDYVRNRVKLVLRGEGLPAECDVEVGERYREVMIEVETGDAAPRSLEFKRFVVMR